jgi:hypothetical protein
VLTRFPQRFLASGGLATWSTSDLPETLRASGRQLYLLCSSKTPTDLCAGRSNLVMRQGSHALYRIEP